MRLRAGLDDIGKSFLRFAEVPKSKPEEKSNYDQREDKARNIDLGTTAANGPAEPIDDSNDRIQGIEQAPLVRDDLAAETNRGNEQPELHNKRNYVTEITIFDV